MQPRSCPFLLMVTNVARFSCSSFGKDVTSTFGGFPFLIEYPTACAAAREFERLLSPAWRDRCQAVRFRWAFCAITADGPGTVPHDLVFLAGGVARLQADPLDRHAALFRSDQHARDRNATASLFAADRSRIH